MKDKELYPLRCFHPLGADFRILYQSLLANDKRNQKVLWMQAAIQKVIDHQDLSREEAREVMSQLMSGAATPAQIGALLIAMRMKGERVEEITGFAEAMIAKATPVATRYDNAVDMVGTGGDGKNTFNISTVAALVAAGAGAVVAKHGNRSVSSKCGSADVLRELGVHLELTAAQMGECLDEVGIAFLFAPLLHLAMKHAIGPRREIGARTVFNILGPLTNPARVRRHLIGVYDPALARPLAEVLAGLGAERALIVHSDDGMDEVSVFADTLAVELSDGRLTERKLSPGDFGLKPQSPAAIPGGSPQENADIALGILNGEDGIARELVIANAGAGLWAAGLATKLAEGANLAINSIDSGKALAKLEELRRFTQHCVKTDEANG